MKVYKHYRPRNSRLTLILLTVLGLGAIAGLVWSGTSSFGAAPPFPVFLAALLIIGINLWIIAGTAVEVRLGDDGHVEFVAPLRNTRIAVMNILSIVPSGAMKGAVFILKHRDGKVRFDPKLNGMHELITELERQNPGIELRGI
jgi:peptidoglycan/LPS O-acetylase OafA/YrhL